MTTDLKPSPELVAQWSGQPAYKHFTYLMMEVATKAAEWGAQQRGVVISIELAEGHARDLRNLAGIVPIALERAIAAAKEKGE